MCACVRVLARRIDSPSGFQSGFVLAKMKQLWKYKQKTKWKLSKAKSEGRVWNQINDVTVVQE